MKLCSDISKEYNHTADLDFIKAIVFWWGTAVAEWLRFCATNHKVAGSIPDSVMEFFIDINPSDHTMALGSTQTPTEMNTKGIS
jgi:hypothetical protein